MEATLRRSMEAELADTLAPHYAIERRAAFDRSQTQARRRRRGSLAYHRIASHRSRLPVSV